MHHQLNSCKYQKETRNNVYMYQFPYKNIDYDTMVGLYDEPIEKKANDSLEYLRKQINKNNA